MEISDQNSDIIYLGEDELPINDVCINDVSFHFECGGNDIPGTSQQQGNGTFNVELLGEQFYDGGDEEDEEEDRIPWYHTPDVVLAKIASYLTQWDKSEMSLVCKNWNRVILAAPRLWRHRIIRLRGNFKDRSHVIYANILGRFLSRLHLSSGLRSLRHARKFQRTFTAIFAELYRQRVQLKELSLTELKFHVHFRGVPGGRARQGIIRSARRFLGRQAILRYLDLNYGGMTCEEGTALLQAASEKSSRVLKALDIEELFRPGAPVHQSSEFAETLPRFVNLVQLTMNYSALSDELLRNLARESNGLLEFFHVRCIRGENLNHIVGTPAWRAFSGRMSKCQLEFSLIGVIRLNDIQRVLTPQMPLQILSVVGHNDDSFQPDRTLKYISRYLNNTVEKVVIDVTPCYKLYGRGFIDIIRDSPRLRHLEVRGRIRWHVIHDVFEFLDINFVRRGVRPPLTTLRMLVTSTPIEPYEEEAFVIEEYRPVFSRFDLMYELVIEPMFFPLPLEFREPRRVHN
nr:F-box only protein 39-like [Lytechinus pictus]